MPKYLGMNDLDFELEMNENLFALGYALRLKDFEHGDDGIYKHYEVNPLGDEGVKPNVQVIFVTKENSLNVQCIMCRTDTATDDTSSTVVGYCFGIAAVLVDETFNQKDLAALQNNVTTTDKTLSCRYEKNDIRYEMIADATSDTQSKLTMTICCEDKNA